MKDADLKSENTALRKQNKNLKSLLEEALEIISKLKEFVDAQQDRPAATAKKKSKTSKTSKVSKKSVKKTVKAKSVARKAS